MIQMNVRPRLLAIRMVLALVIPAKGDTGTTKKDRYLATRCLKYMSSHIDKALKALEPELRADATSPEAIRGESETGAKYSQVQVGDVIARRYDDSEGEITEHLAITPEDLEARMKEWRVGPKVRATVVRRDPTVNFEALRGLRESGHITADQYKSIVAETRGKGRTGQFVVLSVGELKRLEEMELNPLKFETVSEGEGQQIHKIFEV